MTAIPAPKKRATRTPAQRAQDALDVVDRQITGVRKRIEKAKAEVKAIASELTPLEKRREYLAANPDLPEQPTQKSPNLLGPNDD